MANKKIGLALGSGAWRGLAHIGVIKCLLDNNISIDFIAGSSAGSIIGGFYAVNGDIKKLEETADNLTFKKVIKTTFQKNENHNKVGSFLKKIIGNVNIEDLKIPFSAVGSNLLTGEPVVINKGSLIEAIKASSAIPIIYKPVRIDDKIIFDGGLSNPIPTKVVKNMGADIVIGVSLYGGIFPINPKLKLNRIRAGKISRFIYLNKLAQIDLQSADIAINLQIPNENYGFFKQFLKNKKIINYAYETTQAFIPQIKKLIKK